MEQKTFMSVLSDLTGMNYKELDYLFSHTDNLKISDGRNGKEYLWYNYEGKEIAIDIETLEVLSRDDIMELLI